MRQMIRNWYIIISAYILYLLIVKMLPVHDMITDNHYIRVYVINFRRYRVIQKKMHTFPFVCKSVYIYLSQIGT